VGLVATFYNINLIQYHCFLFLIKSSLKFINSPNPASNRYLESSTSTPTPHTRVSYGCQIFSHPESRLPAPAIPNSINTLSRQNFSSKNHIRNSSAIPTSTIFSGTHWKSSFFEHRTFRVKVIAAYSTPTNYSTSHTSLTSQLAASLSHYQFVFQNFIVSEHISIPATTFFIFAHPSPFQLKHTFFNTQRPTLISKTTSTELH